MRMARARCKRQCWTRAWCITNASGTVLGLMPHPERACDPATGGTDGRRMLEALLG